MKSRVLIKWTDTAKRQLAALPPKVRKGLLAKADELKLCDDPRKVHKSLVGPLEGYYRITYARYRAVYTVVDAKLESGDVLLTVEVYFVACGKRKERDRNDVYRIAEKMVNLGLIRLDQDESDAGPDA